MTLAHTITDKNIEEGKSVLQSVLSKGILNNKILDVSIKSEDESDEVDSNESAVDTDSAESENNNVEANENIESNSAESNKESDQSEDDHNPITNTGWVDSISKILKTNKPKGKKTLVLSKAKKLTDVKKEKPKDPEFQIDGETKEEKPDPLELLDAVKEDPDEPLRKKVRISALMYINKIEKRKLWILYFKRTFYNISQ